MLITEYGRTYYKGVWYYSVNGDYPTKANLCIRVVNYNGNEYIGYTEWYAPSEDEIGHGDLVLNIVSNGEVIMPENIEMWCIIDKPPKEIE